MSATFSFSLGFRVLAMAGLATLNAAVDFTKLRRVIFFDILGLITDRCKYRSLFLYFGGD